MFTGFRQNLAANSAEKSIWTRQRMTVAGRTPAWAAGFVTVCLILSAPFVRAADLSWSGEYRVEAVQLQNADLAGNRETSYALHHLILTPKIVAGDGLTIYSRFDILNNSIFGQNNQAGEVFGVGPNASPQSGRGSDPENPSNSWTNTQAAGTLHVTTLYAVWSQEFGQLVVGRMPMQFGLGVAYNAGNGLFDKYIDTHDMVAYKVVMGNLYFMPMIGKVNEGDLGNNDDVTDYMMQVQYENPESESAAGVLYRIRTALGHGNDVPVDETVTGTDNNEVGGPGAQVQSSMKLTQWSLYGAQRFADFHLGLEANMVNGPTGVIVAQGPAQGSNVNVNAFAIAAELRWKQKDSRFTGLLKMGLASGDDPNSYDKYEGFIFNRNYDVGLLMFNHVMGDNRLNPFRTGVIRNTTDLSSNHIDDEAISNAFYFAPSLDFAWRENMSFGGTFVYGMLDVSPIAGESTSKNLGAELDLNFTYKPYERLTWVTELGFLFPGAAWAGGANENYGKGFAYGGTTKAAISF